MNDTNYAIRPNKTQIKREIKVLNQLGKELVALDEGSLKNIPLSDIMRQAVNDGRRFSRGALQRQLRRIASLMEHEDVDAIKFELARLKQPNKKHIAEMHQLEQWRDRLIDGDDKLLTDLIDQYPVIERQHIRQLVRNANKEKANNKPPKSFRLLFKYLSETKRQTTEKQDQTSEPQTPES